MAAIPATIAQRLEPARIAQPSNLPHSIRPAPFGQPQSPFLGTGVAAFGGEVPVVESRADAVASVVNAFGRGLALEECGFSLLECEVAPVERVLAGKESAS